MQYLGAGHETEAVNASSDKWWRTQRGQRCSPMGINSAWQMWEYGAYKIRSVLPDKLGRYFFEYHAESHARLDIPALPEDRSQMNVHGMLKLFQA